MSISFLQSCVHVDISEGKLEDKKDEGNITGNNKVEDNKVEDNTIEDKKTEDNNVENSPSTADSNASVKTGDTTDVRLWLLLLVSTLTVMTGLMVEIKGEK